jgi:salicylate hydroxylase
MAALEGHLALDRTSLLLAPGYHAVCYPLPHRKTINVALFARQKPTDAPGKQPVLPPAAARSSRFDAIMEAAGDTWGYWPLATVATPHWHNGGIGLIGDAAHAMLPFQAQGAAMAIEDAAILAPLLMTEPTAEAAFSRFAAMRMKRVARVARLSARNAAIFHMEWPFSLARDLAMKVQGRTGHLRRLEWLYGFDTAPEVEGGANRP